MPFYTQIAQNKAMTLDEYKQWKTVTFGLPRTSIDNLLLISMGKSLGFNFSHFYEHILKSNWEKWLWKGKKNRRGKLRG